jgi:CRISP-associated protein Cas1
VRGTKVLKIELGSYGSYLGTKQGALLVRDKEKKETTFPLFEKEIGEINIKSGNIISSGALATCGFFGIDVLILTQKGNPVAMLKSLEDDSHVETRVCQYEALKNEKAEQIAKTFVIAKAEGYDRVLKKYGLKPIGFIKDEVNAIHSEDEKTRRRSLTCFEARYSRKYFSQVFQLFDTEIRPDSRSTFRAYDGLNNTLNLAYEILRYKVHIALIRAKLEPYLGFLHSLQFGKPSLVCDFQELYRYLIDDFIIGYCKDLCKRDFAYKTEKHSNKKGKRQYLKDDLANEFTNRLNEYFLSKVSIPRIKVGAQQEIETLLNEEALLFAKYLRNERPTWVPRIAELK